MAQDFPDGHGSDGGRKIGSGHVLRRVLLELGREQLPGLRADHRAELLGARAVGDGGGGGVGEVGQALLGAADAELRGGVRTCAAFVLVRGLAELLGVAQQVAQVVGHLIGFADIVAKGAPGLGVAARGGGAGQRGAGEQGAGLGALVIDQRNRFFRFPGLSGDDAAGRADRLRDDG